MDQVDLMDMMDEMDGVDGVDGVDQVDQVDVEGTNRLGDCRCGDIVQIVKSMKDCRFCNRGF